LPNLVKYALGLNPLVSATNPMVVEINSGYLRLTVPRNPAATDVVFLGEVAASASGVWSTNGTTIDSNTPSLFQFHDNTPIGSAFGRFIRLRVGYP
jgi:hypothetical protein